HCYFLDCPFSAAGSAATDRFIRTRSRRDRGRITLVLLLILVFVTGPILSSAAAPARAHRLAQQPLHLGVHRAQVVGGPLLELLPELGVDTQQELLARHQALPPVGAAARCSGTFVCSLIGTACRR